MLRSSRLIFLALSVFTSALFLAVPGFAAPWLPFGPDGGDARRLATDPHDAKHLFLGTQFGWIYESRNSGANWKRLAMVGKRNDLVLDSIEVDPQDSKHLIVGGWVNGNPDGGIFISTDGGHTWLNQAEMRGQSIRALAIAPSNPKIMVAGSLQGVFQSADGGQRWKRISPSDSTEIHEVESVAIDPVDPNIIYAGTWHLPWKTIDGGEHWNNITKENGLIDDSDVFSIIIDPKAPNIVFASACSGIYKSVNSGARFEKIQGIPATSRRTRVLLQDPNDLKVVYAGTTEGLYKSEDSGKTWKSKTGTEIIVNDVSVDPSNSKHLLIATDRGGVLTSEDAAETFHASNAGYSARQITAMVRDSAHPAVLYVGVVNDKEWGGVFRSDNGGLAWTQMSAGLQGRDIFSLGQTPKGDLLGGSAHGLYRLIDGEPTWARIDIQNFDPDAQPSAPRVEPALVRPPVPIGRNKFAESKPYTSLTGTQKKSLATAPAARKGNVAHPALRRTTAPAKSRASGRSALKGKVAVRSRKPLTTHANPARRVVFKSNPQKVSVSAGLVAPATPPNQFDGGIYSLVAADQSILASSSQGLLRSDDEGATWERSWPAEGKEWHLAAAKSNVVASSMDQLQFSADAGHTWVLVKLPENLTRVATATVEPSGTIWVGGREGVFVSKDAGITWETPKNLYVTSVANLFYDLATNRVLLTTLPGAGSYNGLVFTVQLPERQISYVDSGWSLRFARQVGDHLVAATLYDGIVVQPKMINSPVVAERADQR